ncbi:MAG TPA: ABC transporter ATP-binding protein, partial [Methanocella sp.]|nr:ABC transporter ATP-binding protein [Methanocella sp.]
YRIVMGQGAMQQIIHTDAEEKRMAGEIGKIDDLLLDFRSILRAGGRLGALDMERLRSLAVPEPA